MLELLMGRFSTIVSNYITKISYEQNNGLTISSLQFQLKNSHKL
jgi:hypothetical protein